MVIDQRNAGASVTQTTGNLFPVDRFFITGSVASKFTAQQSSTAPAGFNKSLLITSSSAYSVGSGDFFVLAQNIEGYNVADLNWGTANAKTVTLSFQVYSSLTGTFGGALVGGSTYSYPFTYTVSSANTWTTISVTVAGPTSGGTWDITNGSGLIVRFGLGVGTTYSGTAGSWTANNYFSATGAVSVVGTSGATFYITGVQLEAGTTASPFEYRQYGTEFILCQRYYQTFGNTSYAGIAAGLNNNTNTKSAFAMAYNTAMRAAPTVTFSNLIVTDRTAYDTTVSSISLTQAGANSLFIFFNLSSTAGGNNTPTLLCVTNGTTGSLMCSSEL